MLGNKHLFEKISFSSEKEKSKETLFVDIENFKNLSNSEKEEFIVNKVKAANKLFGLDGCSNPIIYSKCVEFYINKINLMIENDINFIIISEDKFKEQNHIIHCNLCRSVSTFIS